MNIKLRGPEAVHQFCDVVSDSCTANLTLLRAVDGVVDWLTTLSDEAQTAAAKAERFADLICKAEPQDEIDPDDITADTIHNAENAIERLIEQFRIRRQSGVKDRELGGEHEACVLSAYDETIEAFQHLHSAMTALRWAIMEHDADLSPVSGPFSSVEQMLSLLKAG
ncbi:hypothetical protein [Aromatoleum aromaticum]|uniref:Uncharacterized protein n=1 Tax=Aromatoleum aromaticum (strain DSM 19018 / LMG 30748 / EbN1) TaxID=76114 RepID=Q5P711_AROAE|nr:hypothetical protein [Aromatoleum aromaticum]NMG54226.1 hypothetical protein [Aromatoleum aromaticum]CAI06900.1 hypothetical protein ebA1426 [Aromatoleum aromaticum EbN1]